MKPILSLFAMVWLSASAQATTLFSQTPPNFNGFDFVDYRIADGFSISVNSTLTNITFWYDAINQSDLSMVSYALYKNSAGGLGSVVSSGSATATTSVDTNAFLASFNVPTISLTIGNYFLELHGGVSLTDNNNNIAVSWAAVDDNGAASALANLSLGTPDSAINTSGFNQYAFVLNGNQASGVPEPATWALALAALTAGSLRRAPQSIGVPVRRC